MTNHIMTLFMHRDTHRVSPALLELNSFNRVVLPLRVKKLIQAHALVISLPVDRLNPAQHA